MAVLSPLQPHHGLWKNSQYHLFKIKLNSSKFEKTSRQTCNQKVTKSDAIYLLQSSNVSASTQHGCWYYLYGIYNSIMLDKSVCDVSIGEETVDARSPNFAFLSLMNAGPLGPALARGGKPTLARCVWYPGPGLMEKACFHSRQSHLLRATPRLHTHGNDHHLLISHTPRPSPGPQQFVFVILRTRLGGNYEQNHTNNTRLCVFIAPLRCVWLLSAATVV